jgi:hypothetical protein
MMGIDYLGVVAPDLLGDSFIMDMLAPLSFQYSTSVRIAFIVSSVITFLVNPASEAVGDTVTRSQKQKVGFILAFMLATLVIAYAHRLTLVFFGALYPVAFLVFNITGFVLGNLLKTKRTMLERKFGFEKNTSNAKGDYSFHWHSEVDGKIIVENAFRGILLLGGAGSG